MSRRDDDESGDEPLLSRWSRLKRTRPEPESQPAPVPPAEARAQDSDEDQDEAAILARLNLPAPESLSPGDDFSRFMSKEVPAFLRQRALRVLWRSNPDLAVLDGLVDYGEDFRKGDLAGVIQTAYRVGRGFLTEKPEEASEEGSDDTDPEAPSATLAEPMEETDPAGPADAAAPIEQSAPKITTAPEQPLAGAGETGRETGSAPDDTSPLRPRRMVFVTDN